MKNNKILLIRIILTLVFAMITYYLFLPPINIHSFGFWAYIIALIIVYKITNVFKLLNFKYSNITNIFHNRNIEFPKSIIAIFVIIGGTIIANFIASPLFNSKSYANRITINDSIEFTEGIKEVDFNTLPLLDKTSSQKLGDRVMGQMSDWVSQFYVSDLYTQINYNNEIIRVTPLEYASIIKYFSNRKEGIKGYITVNSVNGEAKLIRLDKGMKYMPSALFNENLYRKLRFNHPTEIFDTASFEIDNEGNPYWIVPTVSYKAVGVKKEINGAIILDPITGKSKKYKLEEIPTWVDHIYSASLIIEQVDDWGQYQNGFFNTLFSQKGVIMTTDGYNYISLNDDIYLYTGITSVSSDESNLGFILCNMRTKETNYYKVPGAEEYSAMASAEGQVQQMKYTSTFPLLINLNGKPTYLVSLKDNAGLVKMYAFIDVADYQKVVVSDASLGINKAAANYLASYSTNYNEELLQTKEITIKNISMGIVEGNSYYYIMDTSNQKYKVSLTTSDLLPFLINGDTIKVSYLEEEEIINIVNIEK